MTSRFTFNLKTLGFSVIILASLSACGGGSSSSNSAANVTDQCRGRENVAGSSLFRAVNSCDFNVNFRSISQIDSPPTVINNIQPGGRIALELSLAIAERYIICRAPSMPNSNATRCT